MALSIDHPGSASFQQRDGYSNVLGPQGSVSSYDQDDAQEDLDDQRGWGGDACGRVWDYCSTGLKSPPPPPCTRHPCTCPHHRHQHHLHRRHRHRHQHHRHPLHHCHRHSNHLTCDYSK